MVYNPTVYVNDSAPAISAENLNKMEDGIEFACSVADINTERDKTDITSSSSVYHTESNGATYSNGTITIPTGYSGVSSKLGVKYKANELLPFLKKKVLFTLKLSLTGELTLDKFVFASSTNLGVSMIVKYSGNGIYQGYIDFSGVSSVSSGSYITIHVTKAYGSPVGASCSFTVDSVVPETYYMTDYIANELKPIRDYQTQVVRCFVDYDSIVKDLRNGATYDTDTEVLTVPSGSTGNATYLGVRFLKSINILRGRKFKTVIAFTCSNPSALKLDIALANNNSGASVISKEIDYDSGVAVVYGNMPQTSGSTYIIPNLKIANNASLSESVTLKIDSAETYLFFENTNDYEVEYNKSSGLFMSCFGHSMVQQDRWQNIVCQQLNLSGYENTAIFGGILTQHYTDVSNIDPDSGVIVVWYDTNDWANNIVLGTVADDESTPTTYCGALKYVCNWIATNVPKAKVVLVASPKRFNGVFVTVNELGYEVNNNGDTLEDFADKIKDVADYYSFEFCDLFHKSGCNKDNKATYLDNDNLHPNYYGAYRMGLLIADCIRK